MLRSTVACAVLFAAAPTAGLVAGVAHCRGPSCRAAGAASPRFAAQQTAAPLRPVLSTLSPVAAARASVSLSTAANEGAFMDKFRRASAYFCNCFPLWTIITALVGLRKPEVFLCISTKYFTGMIGLLMLCMGITLSVDDFKRVLTRPAITFFAFLGCYGMLPFLALLIAKFVGLTPALTAGLVLLSAINGAQASNLCNFIAKGDVALSVLMTTFQTVGAIVMTPLLAKILLGTVVPVNAPAVALSTAQVVLVPISTGMLVNANFPSFVESILPFSPVIGVLVTCLLVGSAVSRASRTPRLEPSVCCRRFARRRSW